MPLVHSSDISDLVDETSGKEVVVTPAVVDRFADLTKKYEEFLMDKDTWLKDHVREIILPCDINIFVQQTRKCEDHKNYEQNTGLFISQLIKNSYEAGNNEFELDVGSLKPINGLASNVSGREKQKVRIVIKGKTGDGCGRDVRYSIFTIEEAGYLCGYGARNSTFNTHNPEQYERFKKSVHPSKDNKLYLLSPNGSILKGGPW